MQLTELMNKHPAFILFDLDQIENNIAELKKAFPHFHHHFAIKANPLVGILSIFAKHDLGLEAASLPEIYLAQKAQSQSILFDSPVKTVDEIKYALHHKLILNADSFDEVDTIASLQATCNIGLRINPNVGAGTISSTSVGHKKSRFGVSIDEHDKIIAYYKKYPCLDGIHYHVGSQGISLEQLIDATKKMGQLILEIENVTHKKLWIDIGGGLPVQYRPNDPSINYDQYAQALKTAAPWLFENRKVYTEFGRKLIANCAKAYAQVEWVKINGEDQDLSIHLGADFLLRRAYRPQDWFHKISLLNKTGTELSTRLFGPLCFAGDLLDDQLKWPKAEKGDWVEIEMVGAYTFSMWSRHCSRAMPAIYGQSEKRQILVVLKKAETPEDVVQLWDVPLS